MGKRLRVALAAFLGSVLVGLVVACSTTLEPSRDSQADTQADTAPVRPAPSDDRDGARECTYNGRAYREGQVIPVPCLPCWCHAGELDCPPAPDASYCGPVCRYNGEVYFPGKTFPATDGCNTCTCTERDGSSRGVVQCTTRDCDAGTDAGDASDG